MAAPRVAWRRLAARKLVPAFESPLQRRFVTTQTSNAPQDVKAQAKVLLQVEIYIKFTNRYLEGGILA